MNGILKRFSKYFFKFDFINIKQNFIGDLPSKYKMKKNPYFDYLIKKPFVIKLSNRQKLKKKILNRKNILYKQGIQRAKFLFNIQICKIIYYNTYFKQESKTQKISNQRIGMYLKYRRLFNTFFGYLIFFQIKIIKRINYFFILFLLYYFGYSEVILSSLFDPKLENNTKNVNEMYYIPDKQHLNKKMIIKDYESTADNLSSTRKLEKKNLLNKTNSVDPEIYINKPINFSEKIKMLFLGKRYRLLIPPLTDEDIFDRIENNDKKKEFWEQSFLLRRIYSIFQVFKNILINTKELIFGNITFFHFLMVKIGCDDYYHYSRLTLNERIRVKIEFFKNSETGKRYLNKFDNKYREMIKEYLKLYLLELLKNKSFKDDLVQYLTKFLILRLDFRDFLLEIICEFLFNFINSSQFDNVRIVSKFSNFKLNVYINY